MKILLSITIVTIGLSNNLKDLKSIGCKIFLLEFIGMAIVGLVSILSIEIYFNFFN